MPHEQSIEHACSGEVQSLQKLMLAKQTWAVVGAHTDPDKFGFKIVHRLKKLGYQVFPINPFFSEVDGLLCYPSLADLPTVPEVIDLVVNPQRGQAVLKDAATLGVRLIWSQPGTYDDALQVLANQLDLCILQDCVLAATSDRAIL
jgi:predicted CoA-binding protein